MADATAGQPGPVSTEPGCQHPGCVLAHPHAGPAVLPPAYGDAEVRQRPDGRLEVVRADPVIGISVQLLAEAGDALPVDASGCILLAGDARYRYRPARFASRWIHDAIGPVAVLVCERVNPSTDVTNFEDLARGVRVSLGPGGERHEEPIVEAP